jgi:hypothetical protein
MINFESVNPTQKAKFNKWHLFWILFALNLIGFTAAKMYFNTQNAHSKADTEAVDFKNKFGASVHSANTLANWGLELLHLLRGRD